MEVLRDVKRALRHGWEGHAVLREGVLEFREMKGSAARQHRIEIIEPGGIHET